MSQVVFKGSAVEVRRIIRDLSGALAGRISDPFGIVQGLQLRMGNNLLSKIQQAFIEKARGGTDEAGIKWKPLKPETIAYSRKHERRNLNLPGPKGRPTLNKEQNKAWRFIFATRKDWLITKFGMSEKDAAGRAAQMAWAFVKEKMGATTLLGMLGSREVEILRDTGELFRSFAAGVDAPSGADGQILRLPTGRVIVGTNKKPWHHAGGPKLPARPFWPPDGNLPDSWWGAILTSLNRGIVTGLRMILSQRR